jgi:hypothetical protein
MRFLSVKMLINKLIKVFNKKLTPVILIIYKFKCLKKINQTISSF